MSIDGSTDQTIRLADHTDPEADDGPTPASHASVAPRNPSGKDGERSLQIRRPRGDTLRKELTRLKYARFQEDRYEEAGKAQGEDTKSPKYSRYGALESTLQRIDGHRPEILRSKKPMRQKKQRKKDGAREYVVDILYENQRGWFFCGIPLYSSKSLLNFDPAPWQTGKFDDSPVNITSAQVPDPTWIWVWPSWYVDMSHDVDEEGWEYSLSFRQGFSWHGSQPWFSSFVRRRRWLRKRIRTHLHHSATDELHKGHQLNPDYFTIHADAGSAHHSSRGSSIDHVSRPISTLVSRDAMDEKDSSEEEGISIVDVPDLLHRLKKTTVDRKKLDALHKFIHSGGRELYYLADAMPDIMALFMYQHSRNQARVYLEKAAAVTKYELSSRAPDFVGTTSSSVPKSPSEIEQRLADLNRAITAISPYVHDMDLVPTHSRRHTPHSSLTVPITKPLDMNSYQDFGQPSGLHSSRSTETLDAKLAASDALAASTNNDNDSISTTSSFGRPAPSESENAGLPSPTRETDEYGTHIKGIPAEAHIGEDVGLAARIEMASRTEENKDDE